ncbi:hypothetical protein CERSUDRAFT_119941 [Gelatoporia subvermispora B]|uniref:DUF6534 domain-containing protein n=1 Tax=Ceriporiopsis subvermispora (strain B) TaxID=914234 RepID=M2QZ75_CERS8|nr:hypothetical protein CERSUDRAFT_119941 [Gelatoporia subvermispora B]
MGLLVQSFFAMRVWRTSQGNMIIPILIIGLSLAQFAFGIFYATFIERTQFAPALSEVSWAAATGLACSMTADFLITISLCCYLRRFSSGLLKSDRLISVIIMYIVNTGLLTSVVAVFAIVLTVAFSESLWLAIPFSLVSKCYVNSVLSTSLDSLNARANLRNIHSGPPLDHSMFVHYESTQPDRPSALVVSEVRLAAPVYSVPSKKLTSYGMVISV